MGFKCGIVGLPNVGKSTIFSALTASQVDAQNYPFCTIEPNTGIVAVPDERLNELVKISKSKEGIPTTVEFVDIAGLVKGASKGEGLGNQFLGHIRSVDAIVQVVRCFDDDNITHVEQSVDPVRDLEVIETELMLADLSSIEKRIEKTAKLAKSGNKEAKEELELLTLAQTELEAGHFLSQRELDLDKFKNLGLLTAKPVLYVANVSEEDAAISDPTQFKGHLANLRDFLSTRKAELVTISGKVEAEISQLDEEEKQVFLEELGLAESGLNKLARAGYRLLDLLTFFTSGVKETRAWTCQKGATAPQAAGVIHSDFERGFIRAEVISYDDFISCNGEQGAKEKGKLRVEGKEYLVVDGDVMHFRFNV